MPTFTNGNDTYLVHTAGTFDLDMLPVPGRCEWRLQRRLHSPRALVRDVTYLALTLVKRFRHKAFLQ
jgi:hypothetical protein